MNHSDAVAEQVDALVEFVLCDCSFLHKNSFCIVEENFTDAEHYDVVVIVPDPRSCGDFSVLSCVVAGICHTSVFGVVEFRISEDSRVCVEQISACAGSPFASRCHNGLNHSRVAILEYLFV